MKQQRILPALLLGLTLSIVSCGPSGQENASKSKGLNEKLDEIKNEIVVEFETLEVSDSGNSVTDNEIIMKKGTFQVFELNVNTPGRYRVEVLGSATSDSASVWVEDYINNKDGRTYNITGDIDLPVDSKGWKGVDGSPLDAISHNLKIHAKNSDVVLDKLKITLIRKHEITPKSLTQNTEGEEWKVVWADEFDGTTVDTSKWTYDVGDWGWGNNELQYYTVENSKNARIEDGSLVIEARKNPSGEKWTSARLTTRGKVSFLYGKIEFRAIVPRERGNWAAGWTLGDSYVDEIDWPYCGEIDILESVGYEVDDETGDGIAHATVHTPAYYFKINNQISSTKEVKDIADEWHTYAVEWTPTEIKGFVDGEQYYLYDKIANEKEWPFNQPQNIILNLAMGGGWGGARGMDTSITSQKFILDYVRVYGK